MAAPPPPDPPNRPNVACDATMNDIAELDDAPSTRLPDRPNVAPPSLVFLAFLTNYIGNPQNHSSEGALIIDPSSLGAIRMMMDAEAKRLREMDKRMDQMSKMVETFEGRLQALEGSRMSTTAPQNQPTKQSYARATGPAPALN
ncbi:hypothetical protein PtA15_12A351 [Puccinia triticina]|uniref:Uncharacterized protein n=1 Tax=Puccinia triticina TaxID=208348 RepID=A0ABY7D263_9BASI|nr:uncharacterized protein PtA15_12A351 [Puccinia triticina]WAQ90362.1 hypothetical protein PtA15_12A351 [Puccinia triticina]WAR61679.1 hypothetical protein PtB15_12B369 [Puccinia triticina]